MYTSSRQTGVGATEFLIFAPAEMLPAGFVHRLGHSPVRYTAEISFRAGCWVVRQATRSERHREGPQDLIPMVPFVAVP